MQQYYIFPFLLSLTFLSLANHKPAFASISQDPAEDPKLVSLSSLSLSNDENKETEPLYLAQSEIKKDNENNDILMQLEQNARRGDIEAQHKLGIELINKEVSEDDLKEGVAWLHKAAENGNVKAQFDLATVFLNGLAGDVDEPQAMKWFQKAAEGGYADAQFNLGVAYMYGKGLRPDPIKAVDWYQKAAVQGHMEAQNNLGDALKKGLGIKKNLSEAMKWIRKAAEQGSIIAQLNLAEALIDGAGVEQNFKEAHSWYCKAAESNDPIGQYMLGYVFEQGLTGEQNLEEAAVWYLKAAQQEENLSQFRLATLLWKGIHGKKQPQQAVYWYYKAAKNSNGDAMLRLSAILSNTNRPQLTFPSAPVYASFDDFLTDEFRAKRKRFTTLFASLAGTFGERAMRYKYGSAKHAPNAKKASFYQDLFDLCTLNTEALLQSLEMPLAFLPYKPQPSKGFLSLFGPEAPLDEAITIFHLYPSLAQDSPYPFEFALGKKANAFQRKILRLFSTDEPLSFITLLGKVKESQRAWQTRVEEASLVQQNSSSLSASLESLTEKLAHKAKLVDQMEEAIHLYKTLLKESRPYRVEAFINLYPYEQLIVRDE